MDNLSLCFPAQSTGSNWKVKSAPKLTTAKSEQKETKKTIHQSSLQVTLWRRNSEQTPSKQKPKKKKNTLKYYDIIYDSMYNNDLVTLLNRAELNSSHQLVIFFIRIFTFLLPFFSKMVDQRRTPGSPTCRRCKVGGGFLCFCFHFSFSNKNLVRNCTRNYTTILQRDHGGLFSLITDCRKTVSVLHVDGVRDWKSAKCVSAA